MSDAEKAEAAFSVKGADVFVDEGDPSGYRYMGSGEYRLPRHDRVGEREMFAVDKPIRLEEAARTMGCSFVQTLRWVVLPLAVPGIVAGSLLVFTLSASSFVTPNLLGGPRVQVLATSIFRQVTQTLDWNFAAAQAVILFAGVALVLIPYVALMRRGTRG